ncbi:GNAT family N-acetyltransferase [Flavobacterium sp. TBRC 19031]|uniref:GNAT family N-acetyltransferase n=1 Tax=Flavobacterium mekongense TaxID=3379707 RepID=UPI0039998BF8
MKIREATINDIDNYMIVRMAVKENVLNNPALVPKQDNVDYLTKYGKGWVCEIENTIVGFSIVGLQQRNVWALFVHPEFEGKGIGKKLHDVMIDWYFKQTNENIWLGTEFNTRAEQFYRNAGWVEVGTNGDDEIKFEMIYSDWKAKSNS